MYFFCTYFDSHFLTRGLALYESLVRHCPCFRLFVLCMDDKCYEILSRLNLPLMEPIRLEDFEKGDEALFFPIHLLYIRNLPVIPLPSFPTVSLLHSGIWKCTENTMSRIFLSEETAMGSPA